MKTYHSPSIQDFWCCRVTALLLVSTSLLLARDPVPPEKGSLTDAGKFQAKDQVPAPVPDAAKRLAELGIQADQERLVIGRVVLDRKTRSVSFPAQVKIVDGVIEYVVVHSGGKVHESLFVTDALPQDIHIACLLAGWGANREGAPAAIIVEASWESNGPEKRERIENLIAFSKDHPQGLLGESMKSGPWTYSGSTVDAAGFVATREGSIISVIDDPAALVTNPRPGRADDTLHVAQSKLLPKPGFPVKITLRPADPATPLPAPQNQSGP